MEWFSLERSPFIHSDKGLTLETCPTPHVNFSKSTSNPVSYRLPFLLIPMTCGLYSYAGGGAVSRRSRRVLSLSKALS